MMQSIVVPQEVLLSAVKQELPRDDDYGLVVANTVASLVYSLSDATLKELAALIGADLPYRHSETHYKAWKLAHAAIERRLGL